MAITLTLSDDINSIFVVTESYPDGFLLPLNSLIYRMDGQFIKFYSDFAPIHIEKYTLSQINGGITLEQLKTLFKSFFRSAGLASGIYSGWADYKDTQYTTESPLSLATDIKVTLPNNATTIIDSQKPLDIATFYDSATQKITGRNGDGLTITLILKVRPTTASQTQITTSLDIGGSIGEIFLQDFVLDKGNGVEHYYFVSKTVYQGSTWAANGGTVKIVSTGPAQVYDIEYILTRTHKARRII